MTKSHGAMDADDLDLDIEDAEYEFRESLLEKKEKQRRKTELRRKMEDKLERRRLIDELGFDVGDELYH